MLEQLKDIRANEDITINLLPYFIGISVAIIVFALILFFIMKKKKKLDKKQLARLHLKAMDLENLEDKQIAYQFCAYGHICAEDHYKDEFIKIEKQLERFKYKKEIPALDSELKSQIKDYIKVRV